MKTMDPVSIWGLQDYRLGCFGRLDIDRQGQDEPLSHLSEFRMDGLQDQRLFKTLDSEGNVVNYWPVTDWITRG
jgi:hypothetical protein